MTKRERLERTARLNPNAEKHTRTFLKNFAKAAKTLRVVKAPRGVSSAAFAMQGDGDCLNPRVRDGQMILVEPGRLPQPGELMVLWIKGNPGPIVKILSKEIFGYPLHPESNVVPAVYFEQLNPPKRYQVFIDKVECIARVHSVYDREKVNAAAA